MKRNDLFQPEVDLQDGDLGMEIGGLDLEMDDDGASIEPGF